MTVTYFEMLHPTELRPKFSANPDFRVLPVLVPQWQLNKFCFHLVGSDWNWFSRARWTDAEWQNQVSDARVHTFTALYGGSLAGYFELLHDQGEVEIKFLGLAPPFIGRGFGAHLASSALQEAWRLGPRRVWLHTCDQDHPGARANYAARGMRVFKVDQPATPTTPMATALRCRPATVADIPLLAEWNHHLIRDEGHRNPMNVEQLGARLSGWFSSGEYRATVFSAPGPVGYALHQTRPDSVYLRQFYIASACRRRGLGRSAIELLRTEIWPRDRRLTVEVLCANSPGVAFWRSAGFRDYAITLEIVP